MKRIERMIRLVAVTTLFSTLPVSLEAQLHSTGPVVNGHHHFNAGDIDEHRRFWVDTLGGTADTFGTGTSIVKFPDALIFLRDQAPTGAMIGSTVNHVGFSVSNLRETVDRIIAAGFRMVTDSEAPSGVPVVDDIGVIEGDGPVTGIAYVLGPDDLKVEVLEMRAQTEPILSNHIHFFGENPQQMRAWYIGVFGAIERPGQVNGILGADLPGLGLSFSPSTGAMAGTSGRTLDHIGFEIDGLEAFTQQLEARGITLDVPYRDVPAAGLAIAFISDPWGTSIELTEGLDNID